jgi:hypothetical protein
MSESKTKYWDERRGYIRTAKGGWVVGEAIYDHGYSLLEDFPGKVSFFQVMILHVSGRMPERRLADWVEATFICLSWPDPRIWCNHIGSLGGAARAASVAAICAGTLAADSSIYGVGTLGPTVQFLNKALERHQQGMLIEDFIEKESKPYGRLVVPGFMRPLAKGDERVEAMSKLAVDLRYNVGPYLELAYEISDYLAKRYGESINFSGYVSAFLRDQGFLLDEIVRIYSLSVNGGIHACYVDTADTVMPNSFLPLRCDDIDYQGPAIRSVPDAD